MMITVFYRSNEASNRYVSATRHKTDIAIGNLEKQGVQIQYENLDKRKYQNYFKKFETPSCVFVWHDEEVLIDFIKENFPRVKIETMSGKDKDIVSGCGYKSRIQFKIYDRIMEYVSKNTEKKIVYELNYTKDNIKSIEIHPSQYNPSIHYETRSQAVKSLLDYNRKEIEQLERRINMKRRVIREFE